MNNLFLNVIAALIAILTFAVAFIGSAIVFHFTGSGLAGLITFIAAVLYFPFGKKGADALDAQLWGLFDSKA